MASPIIRGPHSVRRIVYAARGLDYPQPALLQYALFENPAPDFDTRELDLSAFAELGASTPWPFSNSNIPLNGILWLPQNTGPCPLVVIAHGNHNPRENSTLGYEYLADHLASHGVLAASIDANFLNGANFGENDGRAIVHLEHVKQFLIWGQQAGHPLHGRIDASKIIVVGHSRGGEAVGHASIFNRLNAVKPDPSTPSVPLDGSEGLGPYHFALNGIVAIAPTDRQYVPITGPTAVRDNYLLFHGSRDGDVDNFPGYRTYDRSHAVDLTDPTGAPGGYKSLVWIHRANHNYFNSVWQQESSANTMQRSHQEQIAIALITAMARAEFFADPQCFEFLRDHKVGLAAGWLPAGATLVSQHQSPERVIIQHCEESGSQLVISLPIQGSVDSAQISAAKVRFQLGAASHLFQETSGIRLDWASSDRCYILNIDPTSIPIDFFSWIVFRAGQSFEPNNPAGQQQDFTIVFQDHASAATIQASQIQAIHYPDSFPQLSTEPKTVMQTFRIPLSDLRQAGLDTRLLRRIALSFDRTSGGTLYLDDIQVSN